MSAMTLDELMDRAEKVMDVIELSDVPPEVINATVYIQQWMERHRAGSHWELMGICSRNHASELAALKEEVKRLVEKL